MDPITISVCMALAPVVSSSVNAASAFFSRRHSSKLSRLNQSQQEHLTKQNQAMQVAQMKYNMLLQKNNHDFQVQQNALSQAHQKELEVYRQTIQLKIAEDNLTFQKWRLAQEQALQKQLADYQRETQLLIAEYQRESIREQMDYKHVLDTWPLKVNPSVLLENHEFLKVILAPPEIDGDKFGATIAGIPKIEKALTEGLREFLTTFYPKGTEYQPETRPVALIGGSWEAKRYHSEASIAALFSIFRSESVLVIESEIEGDDLNMRFAYWFAGDAQYTYSSVIKGFKFRDLVFKSAKERAHAWRKTHDQLIAQNIDPKQFNEIDTFNLSILEQDELLKKSGVDLSQLPPRYKIKSDDFKGLLDYLVLQHQLIAGFIADSYYLRLANTFPAVAQWLNGLRQPLDVATKKALLEQYQALYAVDDLSTACAMHLFMARELVEHREGDYAEVFLRKGLHYWLQWREIQPLATLPELLNQFAQQVKLHDESVYRLVMAILQGLRWIEPAQRIQAAFTQALQIEQEIQQRLQWHREQEEKQKRLQAQREKERLERERQERERLEREREARYKLLHPKWASHTGEDQYGHYADLKIKNIVQRMRWIEAGTFMMGSPETELGRYSDETLHQVTLTQGFWLADTTVTQALWQAVMESNPSYFKGDSLPVENVSWNDAQAFISQLKTTLPIRLPTEAEWEYACRAGTSTSFSSGENISLTQVNYRGMWEFIPSATGFMNVVSELLLGRWEEEAKHATTSVKSYPANPWGLYDMYGNVGEWCQDWYGAYPSDLQVDPQGIDLGERRVLRGGSWRDYGRVCRSANRSRRTPDCRGSNVGFRFALGHVS